jgi:serine phosphatase RsbU (regulator of sigma subunit)/ligand-binding sensor domain-containing protein
MKILINTAIFLFIYSQVNYSQSYSFKNYGAENNIPDGFIYTIDQSDDGFLWVGTGKGLTRFDGYNFYNVGYPDSSALRIVNATLKDKQGTLWFGCNDGKLYYTSKNSLVQVKIDNDRSISDLIMGSDGHIYVIPQGKVVFSIDPANPSEIRRYSVPGDPVMLSASAGSGRNLLIGTQENILICRPEGNSLVVEDTMEGFDYSSVTSIVQSADSSVFFIGTDGNGLYRLHISGNGNKLTRFSDRPGLESLSIQSMMTDVENDLLLATFGEGVIQLGLSDDNERIVSLRNYRLNSGLITDDVKSVFQDREGNYWFGTYGEGISMLTSYAFGYYLPGQDAVRNNIIYVSSYRDKYILGTPVGFHIFNAVTGKSVSFTNLTTQAGGSEIISYLLDGDDLWIGTGGKGLYLRNGQGIVRSFYRSGDTGSDFIKDIAIEGDNVWLGTTNGVVVVSKENGKEMHRFDINNGLPHNSINKLMVAHNGNVYVGTESERLFYIDRNFNIIEAGGIMYGSTINKVLSFTENSSGEVWAATKSNGIFRFRNDSVYAINRSDDLLSNYCYSILADSENDIWVGHEKGISRYNTGKRTMKVFGTDFVHSGVCNTGGMYESADHKIFIGTTDGLIIYDVMKDRKREIAPFTNINSIQINDTKYEYRPSFVLPYNKKYIVRISYVGINFSNPDKVYYITYLENYDNGWSKLSTSRDASYSLRDGKYRFNLLSVNEDGVSQESPVTFDILIKQPFWSTVWFILLSAAVATGAVILVVRQREKAQKKRQEYLERELEARTRVVVQQKAEIELQNIEITDSINYAKRIQSSILPDITRLKESFRDAFILFQPRDIVSGDFYWFDRYDEEKFILVCADSTGHGVPGAFMSMIGSTLLQDIVTRKKITQPSEILNMLDRQLFSTLNQNIEIGASNDGMDMVVCEFNTRTRHLRFASAMRPVVLFIDHESYYIKGNRSSIGGEIVNEKYFDDQEYYLKENDSIYLFSDGLSDQFGGPNGKKMKIAKLRSLIEEVVDLPMDEQKRIIEDFYTEWKGSNDQVDDVLLMGVRV